MQYVVTAWDFSDPEAIERRLAVRDQHLHNIKLMKEAGNFINGGAILNSEGKMVGSSVYVEFDSKGDLETWLATDPYVTNHVWDKIEVQEIKLVKL